MTDYDGADIVESYLNGLAWTALIEPTYYQTYERADSVTANTIIIKETEIRPQRAGAGKLYLIHTVVVRFIADTKANAYANLWYVIQNVMNYSASGTIEMEVRGVNVDYTDKRKNFNLILTVKELKTL